MKKILILLTVLAISVGWAMSAYASGCPGLMKQFDEKVTMSTISEADMTKAKKLRTSGEANHKKGKHSKSVSDLKKALAMLDKKM